MRQNDGSAVGQINDVHDGGIRFVPEREECSIVFVHQSPKWSLDFSDLVKVSLIDCIVVRNIPAISVSELQILPNNCDAREKGVRT